MESKQHLGIRVVEMLSGYERKMQAFYLALAEHCPEGRSFFACMAKAEEAHALMIDGIADKIRDGRLTFRVAVVTTGQIERATQVLSEAIMHASVHGISYASALSKACVVERTLAEDRFYEMFEDESGETRHMKEAMSRSIAQHVKMVEDALAAVTRRAAPPLPTLCSPE